MSGILILAKRNAQCFFRDKGAVIFSFLTALIVLILYFLFLRNVLIDSIFHGSWSIMSDDQIPALMDTWAMAGVVGIVSVTSCAGSLQCLVEDKVTGKIVDFKMTSMKSWHIALSYVLSAFFVGLVISAATLAVALIFMFSTGSSMPLTDVLLCILLLIPSTFSSAIIMFSLASFIRSMGAFSGFTIVMSTIIGLLYGIYMPMVNLPGSVIFVGNLMPATHMAALFRQILCFGPLEQVFLPEDAAIFNKDMGVDIYLGDFQFDALSSLLYALGISALFFIASVLLMRAKRES